MPQRILILINKKIDPHQNCGTRGAPQCPE